jgi:hypothetical protein
MDETPSARTGGPSLNGQMLGSGMKAPTDSVTVMSGSIGILDLDQAP